MSFGLAGISTYTDLLFEYESFDEILNATMFSESFFFNDLLLYNFVLKKPCSCHLFVHRSLRLLMF